MRTKKEIEEEFNFYRSQYVKFKKSDRALWNEANRAIEDSYDLLKWVLSNTKKGKKK